MDLSHNNIHSLKLGSNSGEWDKGAIPPEDPSYALPSPKRNAKKLLPGKVFAEIPLDACKCYPIRAFANNAFIVVSDRNSKNEDPVLVVKLEPGCKTAPYPQIAFYIKGDYHTENILYPQSDPKAWKTWVEFYLSAGTLFGLINALLKIQSELSKPKTSVSSKPAVYLHELL